MGRGRRGNLIVKSIKVKMTNSNKIAIVVIPIIAIVFILLFSIRSNNTDKSNSTDSVTISINNANISSKGNNENNNDDPFLDDKTTEQSVSELDTKEMVAFEDEEQLEEYVNTNNSSKDKDSSHNPSTKKDLDNTVKPNIVPATTKKNTSEINEETNKVANKETTNRETSNSETANKETTKVEESTLAPKPPEQNGEWGVSVKN